MNLRILVNVSTLRNVNKYVDIIVQSFIHIAAVAADKVKAVFLKNLGTRIGYLREKNGLNQSQLGLECDKDRQSINRLEKGNVNPSTFYLYQIAKVLDVTLAELFDSKELK